MTSVSNVGNEVRNIFLKTSADVPLMLKFTNYVF